MNELNNKATGDIIHDLLSLRQQLSSNIILTRSELMDRIPFSSGAVPVYLKYYGAQNTGRWSGGVANLQNIPRGSRLREAIIPPEGYRLVICDYSSIEARVLAWVAGEEDSLRVFREGRCVYCALARVIWPEMASFTDKEIKEKHSTRRFISKTCVLGLGYGASWPVLERVLRLGLMGPAVTLEHSIAQSLGVTEKETKEKLRSAKEWRTEMAKTDEDKQRLQDWWQNVIAPLRIDPAILWHYGASMRLVDIYRASNPNIVAFWRSIGRQENGLHHKWEEDDHGLLLRLPDGSRLPFPRMKRSERGLTYLQAGKTMHTHGAKLTENLVQSISRHLLRDAWIAAVDAGLNVVLTVHDEIVLVERDEDAEEARKKLQEIMSTPPAWAQGLPLAAEAKVADSYAEK